MFKLFVHVSNMYTNVHFNIVRFIRLHMKVAAHNPRYQIMYFFCNDRYSRSIKESNILFIILNFIFNLISLKLSIKMMVITKTIFVFIQHVIQKEQLNLLYIEDYHDLKILRQTVQDRGV